MITVFVKFPLKTDCSRDAIAEDFIRISNMFSDIPDLLRKYFIISEDQAYAGGVYLWKNLESAKSFHNENYEKIIYERYGKRLEILFLDCPIVVDNQFNSERQEIVV